MDAERQLALAYVPSARRAALEALWRLDVALGDVLATGRDPMISRIRLAWWRESLEKLDRGPAPAEPVLETVARDLLPAGLTGAGLAAMEEGWAALLAPDLEPGDLDIFARRRGATLFGQAALLLGAGDDEVGTDGEIWALADLARRSGHPDEARAALAAARERRGRDWWPAALRPLGMLAMLARRDAARGVPLAAPGSPGRMLRMVGHRLTGR
jgi:phytoene synthase